MLRANIIIQSKLADFKNVALICGRLSIRASSNATPNFDNYRESFQSKSTFDLIRACSILSMCSIDFLVNNALTLMRASERVMGKKLFSVAMDKSFYGQFVAGETGPAVTEAALQLKEHRLTLMIAPALESDLGEGLSSGLLDNNCSEYLKLAELAGNSNVEERTACLQLKMSALVPTDILAQLTIHIDKCKTNEEKLKVIEILSSWIGDEKQLADLTTSNLSSNQVAEIKNACKRLSLIGWKAVEMKIRLLVDMEWTYVNPACSALASAMMKVFNKNRPLACSTVQCYLKGALETFEWENQVARHFGVCYGAKLVRGAYLEKENQVAPHMLCENYNDTSNNYKRVMTAAVENAVQQPPSKYFIIVATHNEEAIANATNLLHSLEATSHPNVAFAQIYGMAEHISLPLAQHDYLVYKSVAFGTLHQVIPYLARRAAENRAIMKGARRERQLMMSEIKRRATAFLN